jgi:hypothetical protein
MTMYEAIYSYRAQGVNSRGPPDYQELALLFIILAMGTLFNLELLPNDPASDRYLRLAEISLGLGEFLKRNTLAGLQTVVSGCTRSIQQE